MEEGAHIKGGVMEQLSIDMEAVMRCRSADPLTSVQAAEKAGRFADSHAGKILRALKQHGPMSPKQMFDFTGLSVVQCDRRRGEMVKAGQVRIKLLDDGAEATHEGCAIWQAV